YLSRTKTTVSVSSFSVSGTQSEPILAGPGLRGYFRCLYQCLRLVQALLIFALGIGVSDYASARLHVGLVALHQHGPYGYAGVQVASEIRVQHRAAVDAAAHRLQLLDDLHCAHLRGA